MTIKKQKLRGPFEWLKPNAIVLIRHNLSAVFLNEQLQRASVSGHWEVVKHLLECGNKRIDPSTYNNQAFRSASWHGHAKIVKLLLECGDERIDPSADNNFAIREASFYGYVEVVKHLLKRGDERVALAVRK